MPKLDRNNAKPLYMQLEEILRNNISNGVWKANERIPSESELSTTYGLSRMTVRSVITQLTYDGLLYRVQGKGTFVAEPKIKAQSPSYRSIQEQFDEMGYDSEVRLLRIEKITAPDKISNFLQLPMGAEVYFSERLRMVQGTPISLHRSFFPAVMLPDIQLDDINEEKLDSLVEGRYGLQAVFRVETLEAVIATFRESEVLQVGRGYPLLKMEGINSTKDKVIFEYTEILFRGDKFKLSLRYGDD